MKKIRNAGGDISVLDESQAECFRGLEDGLSCDEEVTDAEDLPLGRSQRRKNIIQSILAQQQETKELGLEDPKGLQVTCSSQTKWARDRAKDQGQKDFETALHVWMEDDYCAKMLPAIVSKEKVEIMNGGLLAETPQERRATLDMVAYTVSSALAELEDMDELDF